MKYMDKINDAFNDPSNIEQLEKMINESIQRESERQRLAEQVELYYKGTNERVKLYDEVIWLDDEEGWINKIVRINEDRTVNIETPMGVLTGDTHERLKLYRRANEYIILDKEIKLNGMRKKEFWDKFSQFLMKNGLEEFEKIKKG